MKLLRCKGGFCIQSLREVRFVDFLEKVHE